MTTNQNSILIVDDNRTNLDILSEYLYSVGFKVFVAQNGESALKRAKYAQPDIILLDVMMPGIDGFETCRRLQSSPETKNIPIIFMTALASSKDKVKGFQVGAVDYVTKPLQYDEVLARINTHLRILNQAKQLHKQNIQLQQLTDELTSLNLSKDKFFSIVAHDLKGPFLPLLGNAELLSTSAETFDTQAVKSMSGAIHDSAKRVLALLENLLQWSLMQMGRIEYKPVTVQLSTIVTQNVNLLFENARAKQITLRNQVSPEIYIHADKQMIDTVIRNLISNALKFTRESGQVTINCRPHQIQTTEMNHPDAKLPTEFIEVSVADTGVGMNEASLDKLFQIDVHHTTAGTNAERGTGLGLLICQEMVIINGGKIWAESVLEEGTTFRFTVPIIK